MSLITNSVSFSTSTATLPKKAEIFTYSKLSPEQQKAAHQAISDINKVTSTGDDTWETYTDSIIQRAMSCKNAKNTLFLAQVANQFVGYVAFYKREDNIRYPNYFLNTDEEAYCSWTAVHPDFRGMGIAMDLKYKIFEPETGVHTFKGHIRETNRESLRVLEKFKEKGYETTSDYEFQHFFYTVKKPGTS